MQRAYRLKRQGKQLKKVQKLGVIGNEKSWNRAFNRRNLGYFLFTPKVEREIVKDIKEDYCSMYTDFQQRIREEMK